MKGPIRDVFIEHRVHKAFSLYQQHRHHWLHDDQAIVKIHGTVHVVNSEHMKAIKETGNMAVVSTWMNSGLVPIEYSVVPCKVCLAFLLIVDSSLFSFLLHMPF